MTNPYETIEVRPVGGALGAEIHGVDLSTDLPDQQFSEIREVFRDNGVIFFRDQKLTPEQHIAFAERWAPITINRFFTNVEGHPKIALVLKEPDQKKNIGGGWHTDHTYDIEPAMGSILYAHEVPQSGGDTMFASMYAAYETLSDGLKQTLNGLRARHSSRHIFGSARAERKDDTVGRIKNPELAKQDAVHPVVITHPLSGRKSLYVNPTFTLGFEGWTDAESKPLLDYLYAHASQPLATRLNRLLGQPGDLASGGKRLSRAAPPDASNHRRGNGSALNRARVL
jgi:taurine dioxygenase